MDEKQKIEQLKQQGWEDMSVLLDEHMPEDKDRWIAWWYWPAAAAAVLAVALPLVLLLRSGSQDDPGLYSSSQMITQEKAGEQGVDQQTFTEQPKTDAGNKANVTDDTTLSAQDLTGRSGGQVFSSEPGVTQQVNTLLPAHGEEVTNHIEGKMTAAESTETRSGMSEEKAGSDNISGHQMVYTLDLPSFMIHPDIRSISSIDMAKSPQKIPRDRAGHFAGLVFSEMMWSLSDAFGFVNAGPGVRYKTRKWTVGLSAGISLPLPDQKAFTSSNIEFSNQYNFDYAADSKFESSSPGFSSSNSVYYERYSMKPGWMANMSAQYQIANRWGVSADLGRIGFRYDFTQRAVPNAQLAARTDASNLRNSLWYGGLSLSYLMGEHWSVYGGVRMINLLDAGEVGVLPALRVEYRFN